MKTKPAASSQQPAAIREFVRRISPATSYRLQATGFTLIETMVAITLLTVAITAPMTLATKGLSTAYYARDQIAAFHLAQEAIESVRHIRDGNILHNALGVGEPVNLLDGIPSTNGDAFIVDALDDSASLCPLEGCPALKTNGELYGYTSGWGSTKFTRSVRATFLPGTTDEIRVAVTVSWKTGAFASRNFTIAENLYRWVSDGSGSAI
jgi:prepilin-type N-terminal cleavage/methylation domain-containing protein